MIKIKIITYTGDLDYETQTTYSLRINVSDGTFQTEIPVTVSVLPANEGDPTFGGDVTKHVDENIPVGTLIATLNASDADSDQLLYSISSGNTKNLFVIDSSSGQVYVALPLDRESSSSHILTISASETSGGNSASATLTVYVADVNDNRPTCESTYLIIQENEAEGKIYFSEYATLDHYFCCPVSACPCFLSILSNCNCCYMFV